MPDLTADDVKKMTVAKLKAELKARSLPTSGRKDELSTRLLNLLEQVPIDANNTLVESVADNAHSPEKLNEDPFPSLGDLGTAVSAVSPPTEEVMDATEPMQQYTSDTTNTIGLGSNGKHEEDVHTLAKESGMDIDSASVDILDESTAVQVQEPSESAPPGRQIHIEMPKKQLIYKRTLNK